jgi:hypothetical protein
MSMSASPRPKNKKPADAGIKPRSGARIQPTAQAVGAADGKKSSPEGAKEDHVSYAPSGLVILEASWSHGLRRGLYYFASIEAFVFVLNVYAS